MRKIIKLSIVTLFTIIGSILVSIAVTACGSTTTEHTHNLSYYSSIDPSCNTNGRIEHWRCYGCNKMFSDADGINEITDIKIFANGHSYSEEWSNNNTYHWHDAICEHTNLTEDKQIHKFENNICSVCKYEANFTTGLELYEVRSGENEGKYVVKGLGTATDTNLVIPATYDGKEIVSIAGSAFSGSNIKEVTIPKSIKSISTWAFKDCIGLEKVNYLGQIEDWCKIDFDWSANPLIYAHNLYIQDKLLEDLVIPSSITEIKSAFQGANIKSVIIPDSVTSMGSAFSGCNSIKKASVPALAIGSIINPNLEELTITSGEIGKEVLESYNQDKCQNLKVVTIGSNVKSIGERAFMGCKNLGRLTIENGLTSIGYEAFSYCSSLISINLPNSVTTIGSRAFQYCDSIVEFKFGTGIQTIGELAFFSCDSLERISVESENETYSSQDGVLYNKSQTEFILVPEKIKGTVTIPDAIEVIERRTFFERNELTEVVMGDNVKLIGVNAFYYCRKLRKVNLGDGVVSIGSAAFEYCYNLNKINLGNSLKTIDEYAFSGCSNLFSVTLPESLETIGTYAFASCHKLVEICNKSNLSITKDIINNGNVGYGYQVLNIYTPQSGHSNLIETEDGYLFYEDNSNRYLVGYLGDTQNLILPEYFKGYKYSIFRCAFAYQFFESITLPNNMETINSDAFYYCLAKNITIPEGVKHIGHNAFKLCTNLESVTIPKSVTYVGFSAFDGCNNLESVNYMGDIADWCEIQFGSTFSSPLNKAKYFYINGKKVTDLIISSAITSIASNSFTGYESLNSITIQNGVTTIGGYAFYGCKNLKSVVISSSVTSIGNSAFNNCDNLKSVYFEWASGEHSYEDNGYNNGIINATHYYLSDEEPPLNETGTGYNGNYWHYVNGEIVVWTQEEESYV